jgi:xylulose-5-phosphate/fructose-6-phosphate phosphoketolase
VNFFYAHLNRAIRILGGFVRDVVGLDGERRSFRLFGPDETASNRASRSRALRLRRYMREVGDDAPEVRDWTWPAA